MTPEKFFDYLEGKLPPAEKERLERALITDPELQQEFSRVREIHRGLERSPEEIASTTRAGNRGRQLAAAFAVLVAMNVALGLIYIFKTNQPNEQVRAAQKEALRHQLQSSVEKAAAASFTVPPIGMEKITLRIPPTQQDAVAEKIIAAASQAGGSAVKGLPDDHGVSVLADLPGATVAGFRETLATLGNLSPAPPASPAPSPDETVHLEIVLANAAP